MPKISSFTQVLASPMGLLSKTPYTVIKKTSPAFKPASSARSLNLNSAASRRLVYRNSDKLKTYGAYGLLALNLFLLVSYVINMNTSAAAGYEVSQIQKNIHALTEQNKKLNLQTSEVSSMLSLNSNLTDSHFVPANNPEFITPSVNNNQLSQK